VTNLPVTSHLINKRN